MSKPKFHDALIAPSDDGDSGTLTLRIDANARDRKDFLKDRRTLVLELMGTGEIYNSRCQCSHCLNDWDCCGRIFASWTRVIPVKGGLLIRQGLARNI